MAKVINQRELRNDNAAIMCAVENGESFIVTRNGTPIADLVPRQAAKRLQALENTIETLPFGGAAAHAYGELYALAIDAAP